MTSGHDFHGPFVSIQGRFQTYRQLSKPVFTVYRIFHSIWMAPKREFRPAWHRLLYPYYIRAFRRLVLIAPVFFTFFSTQPYITGLALFVLEGNIF